MKKILTLCAVLVPFALTACGSTNDAQDMPKAAMADAAEVTLSVSGMT
ncbi:MAG: hypothetical protein ACI8QC_002166 [Planctomycetota bacterium]|jgi:hypothetical protein